VLDNADDIIDKVRGSPHVAERYYLGVTEWHATTGMEGFVSYLGRGR